MTGDSGTVSTSTLLDDISSDSEISISFVEDPRLYHKRKRQERILKMRAKKFRYGQSVSYSHTSLGMIADKATLRKMNNRESAERSRCRKNILIDEFTALLCAYYVELQDLEAERQRLDADMARYTPVFVEASIPSHSDRAGVPLSWELEEVQDEWATALRML